MQLNFDKFHFPLQILDFDDDDDDDDYHYWCPFVLNPRIKCIRSVMSMRAFFRLCRIKYAIIFSLK